MQRKVFMVGVGGASCSGKTLLAKHVRRIIPSQSILIHQDDFVPPEEQVPVHPVHGVRDWDDPPTCIIWPEFRATLAHIRAHGTVPTQHRSHDHLNKQVEVDVDESVAVHWRQAFERVEAEQRAAGVEVVWVIVDGFVLFWDETVVDELDVRIFLRVPHDVLKARREERQVYVLQSGSAHKSIRIQSHEPGAISLIADPDDAEAGGVWVDPPAYFSQVVYPAYVKAHEAMFVNGDVEAGELSDTWRGRVHVVRPAEGREGMTAAVAAACEVIVEGCRSGLGGVIA